MAITMAWKRFDTKNTDNAYTTKKKNPRKDVNWKAEWKISKKLTWKLEKLKGERNYLRILSSWRNSAGIYM